MRVDTNAVLHSWTLLAAFGGSYAPGAIHLLTVVYTIHVYHGCIIYYVLKTQRESYAKSETTAHIRTSLMTLITNMLE